MFVDICVPDEPGSAICIAVEGTTRLAVAQAAHSVASLHKFLGKMVCPRSRDIFKHSSIASSLIRSPTRAYVRVNVGNQPSISAKFKEHFDAIASFVDDLYETHTQDF
eukprot:scpid75845/ scgid34508/ 